MISNVSSSFCEQKKATSESSSSSEALLKKSDRLKELPEDLLFMLRDYLSFEDLGQWIVTIKNPDLRTKLVNRDYFIQRCVLPEERFGENEWIQKNIAPIPKEMQEILDGPDGHLYTAIFKAHYFLTKEGQIVPARFETIDQVAKKKDPDCPGMKFLDDRVREGQRVPGKENLHWMLVTKTVVEKSRNETWTQQNVVFSDWTEEKKERQGFEITEMETLVYSLFWHYLSSQGEKIYPENPLTFGRCLMGDELVAIGSFSSSGFIAQQLNYGRFFKTWFDSIGVGGERKFFKAIGPWKLESGSSEGLATTSIEVGSSHEA